MLIESLIAILIGWLAGIVVNVLADDLPLRRAVRSPRYVSEAKKRAIHIPVLNEAGEDVTHEFVQQDDEKRPPIAWSGILAFLLNKRLSPSGETKLNWRYPITELFTIFLMWVAMYGMYLMNTDPKIRDVDFIQALFLLLYMAIFSLIVVIDVEHKLILFVVIIPSSFIALADSILTGFPPSFIDSLVGGAMGFIVFFILYNGGFLFTYIMGIMRGTPIDEVAFGYGDVMMAMLSGFILGWQSLIFAMFLTVFLGAFGAVFFLLFKALSKGKYSAFTAIPYGPYIVAGTIILLFFRIQLAPLLGRSLL
ncbi:MAG: A24 family peptidase [bacterium]|nr:A24 family peptidase [bacterium]